MQLFELRLELKEEGIINMTYRERREAKVDRLRDWAVKRDAKASQASQRVHAIADNIPFGQPILVGHHSEAHARRDQERIQNGMRVAVDNANKADQFESRADNIERALETSVYSDDVDAIERLQTRITANEAKRDKMKQVNALYRKRDAAGLLALGVHLETLQAKLAAAGPYWGDQPFMPFELTNLGASIRKDKQRLEEIKVRSNRLEKAAAVGVLVEGTEYVRVTFPKKPEREIIDAMKASNFYWGAGSWNGCRANLPQVVLNMMPCTALMVV